MQQEAEQLESAPWRLFARRFLTLFIVALGCCSSSIAQAPYVKTRLTNFQNPLGAVEEVQVSPDGQQVVYSASQNLSGLVELFSVPVGGGVVTQLNQPMVTGGDVLDFRISPDSAHVIFRADAEIDEKIELFRVPIGGGSVIKVNGPMVPAGDVKLFEFSPDAQHVVYSANQNHYLIFDLYAHNLGTGVVSKLSSQQVVNEQIDDFLISPDSSYVAFRQGPLIQNNVVNLFTVPIDGGSDVLIDQEVDQYVITNDSLEALYVARDQGSYSLLRVPIAGGAASPVIPGDPAIASSTPIKLTSDGARILFGADVGPVDDAFWIADLATGSPIQLSESNQSPSRFELLPDESAVIFLGSGTLRRSPLTGGPSSELADTPPSLDDLQISADGSRILYQNINGMIFGVPADGSSAAVRLDVSSQDHGVRTAAFDSAGQNVLYSSDFSGIYEIYSVPSGGGASTRISDPQPSGRDIENEVLAGDEVFYSGVQEVLDLRELYQVASTGGGSSKLSAPMLGTGGFTRRFYAASPDGNYVVYVANQRPGHEAELWSYSLAQAGPAVLLSENVYFDSPLLIAANSSRVIFYAEVAHQIFHLFSAPLEGGEVVQIDDPLDGSLVGLFQVTPDSQWVVYYSKPDSVTRRVSRASILGGDVRQLFDVEDSAPVLRISPNGQRMVYRSNDNRLMSVPLGSGAAIELLPEYLFSSFEITPDSSTVVYWQEAVFGELYTLPVLGGVSTRLNDPSWPCNGSSSDFTLTKDGSRVHFKCGGNLYTVPIGGGTAEVAIPTINGEWQDSSNSARLIGVRETGREMVTAPIVGGPVQVLMSLPVMPLDPLSVKSPAFAPDNTHIFWLADDGDAGWIDLFTAPFGGETTKVNPADRNVEAYAIASDSERVFYIETPLTSPEAQSAKSELVSVLVEGGSPIHYTPDMADGRNVEDFRLFGQNVLYRANEEQEGALDLFLIRPSALLADGFETGDTSAWSAATP